MKPSLTFLGGAGTVTGSKYLLEQEGRRVLIDCGLFQGYKALRLKNWRRPPVDPKSLDAVVLTHAHLDHSGYLPLLAKNGFKGPVYCTASTRELCGILLPDSGHLQERDAEFANRHHYSKHAPALPLYTEEDAMRVLRQLKTVAFDRDFKLSDRARFRFRRIGHILGAACIEMNWDGTRIVFSGDVGRYDDPLMFDPAVVKNTDYLLIESTYGDRSHAPANAQDELEHLINDTVHRGGTVVVPAFAVGRAQIMLYHLQQLKAAGRLRKELPIFLDSPMAIDASDIFVRHPKDHKLDEAQCRALAAVAHYVRDGEESKALTANPMPKVIISASGMATGGRVLHHLKHYAPDTRSTILFTGFQAGGTRGAAMVAGADSVKIHGEWISVRATVKNLDMLSAHADANELLRWMKGFAEAPRMTFVVHGEPAAADTLRHRIKDELGWSATVPEQNERVRLV